MKLTLTLLLIIFGTFSFSQKTYKYNKKKISEDNYFYMYDNQAGKGVASQLWIVKPSRSFWGSIKEDGSIIIVKQDNRDAVVNGPISWIPVVVVPQPSHPTGNQLNYVNTKYFPEVFHPSIAIDEQAKTTSKLVYRKLRRIRYRDYKFVLQGISVPIKFRKPIENLTYQTEANINVAFGSGLKWTYNWYAANKSFLGQKTNNISFTPGLLLGLGTTDIKGGFTAPTGFKDRKEPIFSFGTFFMLGFNNINIGVVVGKDVALKDGGKAGGWVYNHKTWKGIAVGLDIIK